MPDEHSYKMGEAILFAKSLKHNFVKNYVLKDSNPISEENAKNRRTYVINSEETVIKLQRRVILMDVYNEATKEKKKESFAGLEGKIKVC